MEIRFWKEGERVACGVWDVAVVPRVGEGVRGIESPRDVRRKYMVLEVNWVYEGQLHVDILVREVPQ